MEQFYREFRPQGVEFFTICTRDPHPGENYPHQASYEQEQRHAADCRQQEGIALPIISGGQIPQT
ncbi:MAG: hypothetical protein HYU86_00990 [Chloroflexi bacterium]|nr:hypothetical protein [Chloroflexota bacterium]